MASADNDITIVKASMKYAASFCRAVASVARERIYLATLTGFGLEATKKLVKMIEENDYSQFYALSGERVIGWCDIVPRTQEGFKHIGALGMGVLKPYRGKGLGKALMAEALRHAKEVNRLEIVELDVFESNSNAFKLYESFGFRVEGRKIKGRKIDGVYDNVIIMAKEL
jgi:ribosomal protein S18 acetylase RimI-like enzyme